MGGQLGLLGGRQNVTSGRADTHRGADEVDGLRPRPGSEARDRPAHQLTELVHLGCRDAHRPRVSAPTTRNQPPLALWRA